MAGADVQLKTVDMNREDEHECARDGRPPGPIDHASDAYEGAQAGGQAFLSDSLPRAGSGWS